MKIWFPGSPCRSSHPPDLKLFDFRSERLRQRAINRYARAEDDRNNAI
jgi:hypothetical protein